MKRLFIGIFVTLAAASALLYWTQPDRRSPVPVLLWVTQNDPVKLKTIELFKAWLKEKGLPPVEVKIDNANQDPTKKLAQGLAGVGADLFDIYSNQTDLFASSGMLLDVTEQALKLGFSPAETYPALESDVLMDGRQYGFPRNAGGAVCWLNTETFARYGIPEPNYRWTWDEFEEIGRKFVTAANPPGTRKRKYFVQTVSLTTLRRGLGLSIFNETMTKCILDDPRNAEVMRRYYRWVVELDLIPTVAEQSAMSANAAYAGDGFFYLFATGRYAMLYLPRWALIRLRVQGELPLRVVEPFHSGFPNLDFSCGLVAAYTGSKHQVESMRFLQFLTSESFNLLIASSGDSLPPVPKYVHTEEFMRPPDHPGEWAAQEVFTRIAPEIGIAIARSPFVISGVVYRTDTQIAQSVTAGQLAPEDAGRVEAERLNTAIQNSIRNNEKLRQKYDHLVELQLMIDERRAQNQPVPAAWISNPFHQTYYKAMGWLEGEPQS